MKLLKKVASVFDGITNFLALLAAVLLILIMLSVTYDVVMRYFLGRPQIWVVEIAEYALLYITFLGAAWLLKKDGHVRMDLLLSRLNPEAQAILNTITSIIGVAACLTLTWYSTQVTWTYFQEGRYMNTALFFPIAPILLVIPVGSFLLFIQFLRMNYGYLGSWRTAGS